MVYAEAEWPGSKSRCPLSQESVTLPYSPENSKVIMANIA